MFPERIEGQLRDINERNKDYEAKLTALFMKHCTKPCPNIKCRVPISKDYGGCTHIQCTQCYGWMCWACGVPAKG